MPQWMEWYHHMYQNRAPSTMLMKVSCIIWQHKYLTKTSHVRYTGGMLNQAVATVDKRVREFTGNTDEEQRDYVRVTG